MRQRGLASQPAPRRARTTRQHARQRARQRHACNVRALITSRSRQVLSHRHAARIAWRELQLQLDIGQERLRRA